MSQLIRLKSCNTSIKIIFSSIFRSMLRSPIKNISNCATKVYYQFLTCRTRGTIFFSNATTCPFVDFVVFPPGHGRSVTDFWGWDSHEAQLRCPDGVWVVIEGDVAPRGALNLKSTNIPRPWSRRESSSSRKIPTVEPGIEPGTSWLVVRDSDH